MHLRADGTCSSWHMTCQRCSDIEIPGSARNVSGGENAIIAIYHSRRSVADAACDAGLALIDERDLWIDRETAVQMFGVGSIGCMPTTPTYWMLTLAKSGVVTNGHADAALLNGFISEHQAVVASSKHAVSA